MRFSLLVVFVYELRVIANPVPDSTASSSEDVFGSNGLISPLSDGSLDDDAAWNSDESTNGPFPSSDANERGPEGSGLALGSAEAPHSNDPTSAVKCDGSQSSSIIQGDPAMLTGRDLIDSFPETQELKAPSNDLLSEAKCPDPDSDAVPDMVPLDLLAPLPGFRGGECPPDFPVPLFCEGPWIGFDILVCSLYAFTPFEELPYKNSYCCKSYEIETATGKLCVPVQWPPPNPPPEDGWWRMLFGG